MKKLAFFLSLVAILLVAGVAKAEAQPTCDEGSHYVGVYEEVETCQNVCTLSFFGHCFRYEEQCTTTGSWNGTCEADEVVVEEEEEEETGGGTEAPAIEVLDGSNLISILNSYCKDDQVAYTPWQRLEHFNLEIRHLELNSRGKSAFNGCTPTAQQQINQLRITGSDVYGLQL